MPAHQACYDVLLVCLLLLPNQGRVPNQPNAAAAFPPLELMEKRYPNTSWQSSKLWITCFLKQLFKLCLLLVPGGIKTSLKQETQHFTLRQRQPS